MMQTAASFPLNNLPKVIEPVGFGDLRKVVVDVGGASPNNVESAQHKPELCPTRNREVVNPSGLAETKDQQHSVENSSSCKETVAEYCSRSL